MKKFIGLGILVALVVFCCGKSVDDLPCEMYNYGVVDVLNSSGEDRMLAYCPIDEESNCIGDAEIVLVKPYTRGAVRLRLAPGKYHILITTREGNHVKNNTWEITVDRCENLHFHIQRNTISCIDQPYHHLAG
jgi:hypothetical protein